MAGNIIKLKHGKTAPTKENLEEYELGYYNGALYIKEEGAIKKIEGGGGGGDTYVDEEELNNMLDDVFGDVGEGGGGGNAYIDEEELNNMLDDVFGNE